MWSDDENAIILNVGVLMLFEGGRYGSDITLMMLQLVPAYKEQLLPYYRVVIMLNINNIVGQ